MRWETRDAFALLVFGFWRTRESHNADRRSARLKTLFGVESGCLSSLRNGSGLEVRRDQPKSVIFVAASPMPRPAVTGPFFMTSSWLWAVFTVTAAGAQTLRNAMQRDLVDTLGPAAATFVRFIFGLPFALAFLAIACVATTTAPVFPGSAAAAYLTFASLTQIGATALMLAAMRERSFVVATALTKTEAVQIVIFGLLYGEDRATGEILLAVTLATVGVLVLSMPSASRAAGADRMANWRAAGYGLSAAAAFGLATLSFREGILALDGTSFIVAAASALAFALVLQTGAILLYLMAFDIEGLRSIAREWRASMTAGFMGALATQFWFLAFAIETAARVRTLGLVEVAFAQIVTRRMFRQTTRPIEWAGMALILVGVAIALNSR
jgi:drug/metabolite transporter (DMT)-like permease